VPGPEASDKDVEIVRYVHMRPEPFATARDIEKHTDVGYKQTPNRMNQLVEKGLLKVKKVGTTKVYWLSDEGKEALADASR
jgi:predicted transcriptional regulator